MAWMTEHTFKEFLEPISQVNRLFDNPFFYHHYPYNQWQKLSRLRPTRRLVKALDYRKEQYPRINIFHLATVDVSQIFDDHPKFLDRILEFFVMTFVFRETGQRKSRNPEYSRAYLKHADDLLNDIHAAIPFSGRVADALDLMTHQQIVFAAVLADLAKPWTELMWNTLSVANGTELHGKVMSYAPALLVGAELLKKFLPRQEKPLVYFKVKEESGDKKPDDENKKPEETKPDETKPDETKPDEKKKAADSTDELAWAKVSYTEGTKPRQVRSEVVPVKKHAIVIEPRVAENPYHQVMDLQPFYDRHLARGDDIPECRYKNRGIRLNLIDDTLIWLSVKQEVYGTPFRPLSHVHHSSYFPQFDYYDHIDSYGYQSLGPIFHLMATWSRLNFMNAERRFASHPMSTKENRDTALMWKNYMLENSNIKIAVGLSDSDTPASAKFGDSNLPCVINVEVLSEYVDELLQRPTVGLSPLLQTFYFSPPQGLSFSATPKPPPLSLDQIWEAHNELLEIVKNA